MRLGTCRIIRVLIGHYRISSMKILQAFFWTGLISVLMIRLSFAWSPADQHDAGLMEQRLFQQTYDKEAPEVRVNRLENSVYGTTRTGTPRCEKRCLRLGRLQPFPTRRF